MSMIMVIIEDVSNCVVNIGFKCDGYIWNLSVCSFRCGDVIIAKDEIWKIFEPITYEITGLTTLYQLLDAFLIVGHLSQDNK